MPFVTVFQEVMMRHRTFPCLVALCCLCLTAKVQADDAPAADASGEAALPSALDIAPAGIDIAVGVNRLGDAYERFWLLLDAVSSGAGTARNARDLSLFRDYGPGVFNFDGPLTVFQMNEPSPMWANGAAWVVQDKATALQRLGAPVDTPDRQIFDGPGFIGGYLYAFNGMVLTVSDGPPADEGRLALEKIIASPSLREQLPETELAPLAAADLVAVVGNGESWEWYLSHSLPPAAAGSLEELTEDQQVQQEIRQLAESVNWLTLGVTVDLEDEENGAAVGAMYEASLLFDPEADSETTELLARLTCDQPATLAGLPAGDPLLVFTGSVAGEDNRTYYRHLVELGVRFWNQRHLRDSLSSQQFYVILEEVGEHAQGLRVAAYRNPDPNAVGLYSVVFIADADDPGAFIQELQQMMRLARADEIDAGNEGSVTDAEIEALVRNLGDRLYRVRRDATNRLLLIGLRSTPFLEAALDDESLELRTRARVILEHFATLQHDEARHFFGSDLLEKLDPDFRYVIAGESLADGTPVDWISVTVPEESQADVRQLEAWLGPDWNRWRVVQTEDHIAVCIGSQPELLGETLANLGQPEQVHLQIANWCNGEPHQFELHFDAYEFIPESRWRPSPLEPGVARGLTSFGINIESDAVRIDAYSPVTQLRRLGSFFF